MGFTVKKGSERGSQKGGRDSGIPRRYPQYTEKMSEKGVFQAQDQYMQEKILGELIFV